MHKLTEKIAHPFIRVVCIEGPAGIGKTQCALAILDRIHGILSDAGSQRAMPTILAEQLGITGVVYFSFREVSALANRAGVDARKASLNRDEFMACFLNAVPEVEADRFRSWLRSGLGTDENQVFAQLLDTATRGTVVVFFDNFEDALENSGPNVGQPKSESLRAFFSALFAASTKVTVLVTSRRSLWFPPAVRAAVHQPRPLEILSVEDSCALLRELDEERGGHAKLLDAEEATLIDLAAACQYTPRALELALALLLRDPALKPAILADKLRGASGERSEGVLERSVRAVWDIVHPEELEVAKALAILGRIASAHEIAAVLADRPGLSVDKCLEALAEASLVGSYSAGKKFSLHESDRRHLLDKVPQGYSRLLHRAAAAAARARRCAAEAVTAGYGIDDWEEEFVHLVEAGDPRAAWEAIQPIVGNQALYQMFHGRALLWIERLLGVADVALRRDILPTACVLLHRTSSWRRLFHLSSELKTAWEGSGDWRLPTALVLLALALEGLGDYSEGEHLLRRALLLSEETNGSEDPEVAVVLTHLADFLRNRLRYSEAEPHYRRALCIQENVHGMEHPDSTTTLTNLAVLLQATNRNSEAERLLRRALNLSEGIFGSQHPNVASCLSHLGLLLQSMNRHREAETLLIRSQTIYEASLGRNDPHVGSGLRHYGNLLRDTGRSRDAKAYYHRALEVLESTRDPDVLQVAATQTDLATLLRDTDRHREAKHLYYCALKTFDQSSGDDHPETARAIRNLGVLFDQVGRPAEAEPLLRRALAIDERVFGHDHLQAALDKSDLARLMTRTDRVISAVAFLDFALAKLLQVYDDWHWLCGSMRCDLASALLSARGPQDAPRALEECQRAISIVTTSFSHNHWRVASILRVHGAARRANGQVVESVASLRESVLIFEAQEFVPLMWTADTFAELAGALAAVGDAAGADAARAKSADYRRRYDEQEAEAAAKFPLPPLPDWVEALIRGA